MFLLLLIKIFSQSASVTLGTSVAHIGRLLEMWAAALRINQTFVCAFPTGAAFITMLAAANLTGGSIVFAMESVNTIVEWFVGSSFLFEDDMAFYLF